VATTVGTTTDLDYVELFAAAAERFAVAVASCDMRSAVPGCPGWSTYDLVTHLGNVHAWAATIVETGAEAVEQNDEPRSRRPRTVSAWYAGKAEDLYEVLRNSDPRAPCWNFAFGDGPTRFWMRRQLHETTMHAVDLAHAAGGTTDVEPAIAADGIDEVLRVMMHRMHRRGHRVDLAAPLCLEATDTGNAWTLTPRPAGSVPAPGAPAAVPAQGRGSDVESVRVVPPGPPLVVDRRHPVADRVSAPAGTLYRLLWKRAPADEPAVEVAGDAARVRAFLESRLVP
jgi:uncharacterized protein (TIGR03083 family)